MRKEKLYNTWTDMKRRAKKQNINIYYKWEKDYPAFKEWAYENGYIEGEVALVREDNNLDYDTNNFMFVPKYSHTIKHGYHKSRLYLLWANMRQKYSNPNNPQYKNYGAKGITASEEWQEFTNFKNWAEQNGYHQELLLDRKDLSQHFTPDNTIFTTRTNHSSKKNSPIINKSGTLNPMYKHGKHDTRLYNIWDSMKQRCMNEKQKDYKNYGRRGIEVCKEWLHFNSFYTWAIQNNYNSNLTLERLDNDGNYEPNNCCWKTLKEQARNKRTNHLISINGETMSIAELSEISGIPPKTLRYRIINNWPEEEILSAVDRTKKD